MTNYKDLQLTETHEAAVQRIWSRVAEECPNFTRDHDPMDNPWWVEDHVLEDEQKWKPFPGAKALDLGANAGIVTAYWAVCGVDVTAYEADPESYKIMIAMLQKTHLTDKVRAVNAAVWKSTGTIQFKSIGHTAPKGYLHRNGSMCLPPGDEFQRNSYFSTVSDSVTVPCVSFAEILGTEVWDFIKFDIEGAEVEILLNTDIELLKRQVRAMQVELHDDWGTLEQKKAMIARMETVFDTIPNADPEKEYWVRNWVNPRL